MTMERSRSAHRAPFAGVTLFTVLLLAGPSPGPAAGQSADGLGAEFTGETLAALEAEIRAAEGEGLPPRPLVLKALEGRSKGAGDDQILAAVAALRGRLVRAAAILGARDEDVLVAASAALYVGVDDSTLRQLTASTREDALGMAFVVVGDLIRRGVPPPDASQAVVSLAAAGARAQTFDEFRRQVNADIATGLAPAQATEVRMRGVLMTMGGPGPR